MLCNSLGQVSFIFSIQPNQKNSLLSLIKKVIYIYISNIQCLLIYWLWFKYYNKLIFFSWIEFHFNISGQSFSVRIFDEPNWQIFIWSIDLIFQILGVCFCYIFNWISIEVISKFFFYCCWIEVKVINRKSKGSRFITNIFNNKSIPQNSSWIKSFIR